MVAYRNHQSFVIADIPGIIEGASEGKGLGLRFLRHIERNALLLFMIPCDSPNIKKEYKILLNELKSYNPELMDKKRILAITKCDLQTEKELKKIEKMEPKDIPVLFISSVNHKNLQPLKDEIWRLLNN
jgi:GTP-binding protein